MEDILHKLKLCLITNIGTKPIGDYLKFVEEAVNGGVTMVQLREKSSNHIEIKNKALALQELLKKLNIPLIINDFVELAAEIDANGVHLGNDDISAVKAREILGPNKIIGVSIESFADLDQANNAPIDYVTASAIFPSSSKLNCKKFWGIEGLKEIVAKSIHPVTAIGGINPEHKLEIYNTGAKGIAVISAIHDAANTYQAARSLLI